MVLLELSIVGLQSPAKLNKSDIELFLKILLSILKKTVSEIHADLLIPQQDRIISAPHISS
jgi:hypothetical protein